MGVLARRRLRRDARAARQQGRKSRRDDAGTGYREGARWLHHHHRRLRRIHAQRRPAACWSRGPDRRCRGGAGARKRQALRRSRRPAAALGAVGRPGIDARHARHDPEPRVDRVVGGRSTRRTGHGRFAWDSRRRLVQMFSEVARGVDAGRSRLPLPRRERRRMSSTTATSTRPRSGLWSSASSTSTPATPGSPFPRIRRISFAWRFRPYSTPGTTSAPSPTVGSTAYPMTLARRSRSSGWSSGTLARARERGWRSPGTRATEALGRTVTSSSTRRGRTWSRGSATPRTSTGLARRMPEIHAELLESLSTARAPLPRHPGRRVHGRGGTPVHPPDAKRQAARPRRGPVCRRCCRRGDARA